MLTVCNTARVQARNQLGTPGGVKSFLRGAQIFWTMSNIFKLYPTHFSRGGEKISRGSFVPPASPLVTGLRVCMLGCSLSSVVW